MASVLLGAARESGVSMIMPTSFIVALQNRYLCKLTASFLFLMRARPARNSGQWVAMDLEGIVMPSNQYWHP